MGTIGNDQKASFQDRLQRIQANGGTTPEPVLSAAAAPKEWEMPKSNRSSGDVSPLPSWQENIKYPLSIVGAFLVGILAVFISRYGRFHISGGTLAGEDPDLTMMIDGALAAGLGFALRTAFRFESKEYITAKMVGIAVMIATMHNLVHWTPNTFTTLFSEQWTREVVWFTEPNSILFRGVSFVLVEPDPNYVPAVPPPDFFGSEFADEFGTDIEVEPERALPRVFYVD